MVVFTCTHCGDSLQKPKVEKHYQTTCRNTKSLTCVDCLKDFREEEYVAHTKCITEEERYAAKGAHLKPVVKKGEVKQESWTELIKKVVDNAKAAKGGKKRVLELMASSVNVPRKKSKFINFIKSSTGGRISNEDVEAVWSMIEQHKSAEGANVPNDTDTNNTETNQVDESKKKRKSKEQKPTSDTVNQTNDTTTQKRKSDEVERSDETAELKPKKHKKKADVPDAPAEFTHRSIGIQTEGKPKKKKKSKGVDQVDVTEKRKSECNENSSANDAGSSKKKHKTESTEPKEETPVEPNDKTNENADQVQVNGTAVNVLRAEFSYQVEILKALSKKTLTVEKLQKKVLSAHFKQTGRENSPKIIKKFNEKLKKLTDRVEINENIVKLINKA